MTIKEEVLSVLNKSNWTPNKNKDISGILDYWEQQKYDVSKYQIEFITNFAFLKINFNNHSIDIDPFSNYVDDEVFKIYEDYFKMSLIPIGLMRGPDTYLFIGKNGNIYGSFDEYACVLGKDFFQFIENLIGEKIFFDVIDNFYEL